MSDILNLVVESEKRLFVGLAGPGTGKSHTFGVFAASKQFEGKRILILSFINKLIDDLKNDFTDFSSVEVSTLHAFAMQEYTKHTAGSTELDEGLDDIVTQDSLFLLGDTADFRRKFYNNLLEDELEKFYDRRASFYGGGRNLHSFSSIIYKLNKLYDADSKLIPKYDLILVDEFQDFNELEWQFISWLNKKNKVVVVGDDDQSLYGWKDAQPQLIRSLFTDEATDTFSLDYCFRCTGVIVDAVNSLIASAKKENFLNGRVDDKKFIYPTGRPEKDAVSAKFDKIDFLSSINGNQLFYQLASRIKKDVDNNFSKRVLVLVPSFFKQQMYDGLVKEGLNVVEFEVFGDEKHKTIKHRYIIESFKTLEFRKTDNLALRKVLHLYGNEAFQESLIKSCDEQGRKIWSCLDDKTKKLIESDIALFRKVRQGRLPLLAKELVRLNEIFNLKNLLSKMINGFRSHTRNGIEVELTTVMSSKGLSADFVYYVGVDDYLNIDRVTRRISDNNICEFLVGITRAKEKLTLISFRESNPKLVTFISDHINRVLIPKRKM